MRSFVTGHRSSVTQVKFHPYGVFFCSVSEDTNLKVWDMRDKNCIQIHKGHLQGIRSVSITPDGKWILTGGDDGIIKVYNTS